MERSQIERTGGPLRRDSAGTSSDKVRENRTRVRALATAGAAPDVSILLGGIAAAALRAAASSSSGASALSGAYESAISVPSLSPVTSSAQDDSTSELLRFL